MPHSLRMRLLWLWMFFLVLCAALGAILFGMYRESAGVQITQSQRETGPACTEIAARYKATQSGNPVVNRDLLNVLLELMLTETPGIEGGAWDSRGGFLAYAYPTYVGTGTKRDIPEAERSGIAQARR